jgi:hypothetical protein
LLQTVDGGVEFKEAKGNDRLLVLTSSNGRKHGFLRFYCRLDEFVNNLRNLGSVVVVLICVVLSVPWRGQAYLVRRCL